MASSAAGGQISENEDAFSPGSVSTSLRSVTVAVAPLAMQRAAPMVPVWPKPPQKWTSVLPAAWVAMSRKARN